MDIAELRESASRELNTLVEEVRATETLNNDLSWKENEDDNTNTWSAANDRVPGTHGQQLK